MESKIDKLASSITSLIRSFLQTEVGEYRENYEYMLNSPLCRKLLGEIDRLKKENQVLSSQERPNIELEIMEDVEEVESPYEFDRKYKSDTRVSTKFAQIKSKEEVPEEEVEEASSEEEGDEVQVMDEEEGGEDGLGEASHEEEEVEEVEETDEEEEEVEVTEDEDEEVEEVEVTDEEEVEVTDEEDEEEVEVTEDEDEDGEEGLGEASQEEEEEDEEEEVFEFEYKGVMYFATDEVNGVLYACVDDDIGDEVGKIENKNVILY